MENQKIDTDNQDNLNQQMKVNLSVAPVETKYFRDNLEKLTNANNSYRRVIFTTDTQQLVLMSLESGVEIGEETHPKTTQFIRVEEGTCTAVIDNDNIQLGPNDAIVIPPGVKHNIINKSNNPVKLYTIYSPPEHKDGLVEQVKKEKEADMEGGSINKLLYEKIKRDFRSLKC